MYFISCRDKVCMEFFAKTRNFGSRDWSFKEVCSFVITIAKVNKILNWFNVSRDRSASMWLIIINPDTKAGWILGIECI